MAKRKYASLDEVPENVKNKLEGYVSAVGRRTFVIRNLPSELKGGVLARYSRASTGLQLTLVNEFLDEFGNPSQERGSELMDRVLNQYGDESVGELEGAHVGIEDVSQLGTKKIEEKRIGGSPIEQSTRYVKYDQRDSNGRWRYLRPKEITGKPINGEFESVNDRCFEVYREGISRLAEYFARQLPLDNFEIDVPRDGKMVKAGEKDLRGEKEEKAFRDAYNFSIRCAALDVGRCILPSSTLTHLGLYGNGRFFTNLVTSLKSSELEEERERGYELEEQLNTEIPTFIKRNQDKSHEVRQYESKMRLLALNLFNSVKPETNPVTLVEVARPRDAVLASGLFPYTNISLKQIADFVEELPEEQKNEILTEYIGKRESRRDRSGRGLEAGYPITFDLVGGFAEYRDLQRHRMLTQQRQLLSTDFGFIMPPEMIGVGLEKEVEEVVEKMENLNYMMKKEGLVIASQYATLFNHRMRFMLGMNWREFQHLSELRTQPAGHFSYRGIVMEMTRQLIARHPWAGIFYQFVDYSDPGNKITRAKEQSRIAGKNITARIEGDLDF